MREQPEAESRAPDLVNLPSPRSRSSATRRDAVLVFALLGLILIGGAIVLLLNRDVAAEGLVFVIPAGAAASIANPTIDSAIAIPTRIEFAPGEAAVITIRNEDTVPHRAGPFLVGANQTFVQRFPAPGLYPIACAVDPLESIVVEVQGPAATS